VTLYTIQEVAEILKISTKTVRDYLEKGLLKQVPNMGVVRVTKENLEAFIKGE